MPSGESPMDKQLVVLCGGIDWEIVEEFKYFGSVITADLS